MFRQDDRPHVVAVKDASSTIILENGPYGRPAACNVEGSASTRIAAMTSFASVMPPPCPRKRGCLPEGSTTTSLTLCTRFKRWSSGSCVGKPCEFGVLRVMRQLDGGESVSADVTDAVRTRSRSSVFSFVSCSTCASRFAT